MDRQFNRSQNSKNRQRYRVQLISENVAILTWTVIAAKLVIFKQYPRLNLPIKFFLFYGYTATLDPLVAASGFAATRIYDRKQKGEQTVSAQGHSETSLKTQ